MMASGIDLLLVGTNNTPWAGFAIMSALGQKQTGRRPTPHAGQAGAPADAKRCAKNL